MAEPETILSAPEQGASSPPPAVDAADLDLNSYSARYSGLAKIRRLKLVAERCRSLREEAYRLLLEEYKTGLDTNGYREVCEEAAKAFPSVSPDEAWISRTETAAAELQHKLEAELTGFRSSLDSKAILRGTLALGDFFLRRGELYQAQRHYLRARDYTSTPADAVLVYLNVIKMGMWSEEYNLVFNYIAKAEGSVEAADMAEEASKVAITSGLALLSARNYAKAAKKFISAVGSFPSDFDDLLAPEDVALFVGILSLASFNRGELRDLVVENNAFQNLAELLPEVNQMVSGFYESRYGDCLGTMARLRSRAELDPYLNDHCEALFKNIRDRCLQQYFSTYHSVKFDRMAATFGISAEEAEERAVELIADGKLAARVDSEAQALYAATDDAQGATFREVLKTADHFLAGSRALLLRMSIVQHNLGLQRGSRSGPGEQSASRRVLEAEAPMEMDVESS